MSWWEWTLVVLGSVVVGLVAGYCMSKIDGSM
jgi:hypothetical protein